MRNIGDVFTVSTNKGIFFVPACLTSIPRVRGVISYLGRKLLDTFERIGADMWPRNTVELIELSHLSAGADHAHNTRCDNAAPNRSHILNEGVRLTTTTMWNGGVG